MKLLALLLSLVACAAPANATAPIERTASRHDLASVYGYAANNPVTHTDRRGTALDGYPRPEEKKAMEAGKDERNAAAREAAVGAIPIYGPARAASASFSAAIDAYADGRNVEAAAHAAGGVGNSILAIVPLVGGLVAEGASAIKGAASTSSGLPDSALVCRGGTCTADRFAGGTGVTLDSAGKFQGVSVTSAPGASVKELSATFKQGQVGVTTVGDVRALGGEVTPSATSANPLHCTMCGVTPQEAERLFTPTQPNPNR